MGGVTFRALKGQTVTSEKVTATTNPRTTAQMQQRVQLANLVSTYRLLQRSNLRGFQFKKEKQSDYNAFVSNNINVIKVYLAKQEAAAQSCIAAPYLFSQGSLPSIVVSQNTGTSEYITNLLLEHLTNSQGADIAPTAATIAQFSAALVQDNAGWQLGDQLSFISLRQITDQSSGFPYVELYRSDIVLSDTDERVLGDVVDSAGFATSNHYLAHDSSKIEGAFAWVHSRNVSGKLNVSTQRFICVNSMYNSHTTDSYLDTAIRSYSDPTFVFLDAKESLKQGSALPSSSYQTLQIDLQDISGDMITTLQTPYQLIDTPIVESGWKLRVSVKENPVVEPTECTVNAVIDGVQQSIVSYDISVDPNPLDEGKAGYYFGFSGITCDSFVVISVYLGDSQIF